MEGHIKTRDLHFIAINRTITLGTGHGEAAQDYFKQEHGIELGDSMGVSSSRSMFIDNTLEPSQLTGVIAHETFHLAMKLCESIGEEYIATANNNEFVAYLIECIAQEMHRLIKETKNNA